MPRSWHDQRQFHLQLFGCWYGVVSRACPGPGAESVVRVQLIESKERELQGCIAMNYNRVREVEKELSQLQLQLRITAGPKRSALELIRKKIELQNAKVVLARDRHKFAQQVRTCCHNPEQQASRAVELAGRAFLTLSGHAAGLVSPWLQLL